MKIVIFSKSFKITRSVQRKQKLGHAGKTGASHQLRGPPFESWAAQEGVVRASPIPAPITAAAAALPKPLSVIPI